MKIFSFVGGLVDRLCIVAGAFIGTQLPQFMQQYTQRLAGHAEALQKLIAQMRQIASLSHRTLEQYIQKFQDSGDPDFVLQGQFMQGILQRWQDLQHTLDHLVQSPLWLRPYYFFKEIHTEIFHSTFSSFQLGFNFTVESLCYAGAGMIMGWLIYRIISKLFTLSFTRALTLIKQRV